MILLSNLSFLIHKQCHQRIISHWHQTSSAPSGRFSGASNSYHRSGIIGAVRTQMDSLQRWCFCGQAVSYFPVPSSGLGPRGLYFESLDIWSMSPNIGRRREEKEKKPSRSKLAYICDSCRLGSNGRISDSAGKLNYPNWQTSCLVISMFFCICIYRWPLSLWLLL